ncbi:hypothetical protein [Haliangium sp. UPWRP_2]|uniref:hypothetical protein n=1 Tax=Haliangium sp. UPWRP_2 TaxID=1931276 RepID=UPI0011B20219|nr:hypothetical protein [Haliangium sp. UPWRP_2]
MGSEAFLPDERTGEKREDGALETSINWEDGPTALALLQEKRIQSEHGIARLARKTIDNLEGAQGLLSYERCSLEDNPYHGNILFSKQMPKPLQKMAAAALTLASEYVPPIDKKKTD